MSSVIDIYPLSQFPEYIPVISDWLYAQWNPFMAGKTIGDVIELFQERVNTEKLPLTYLAFSKDELCGTVSLVLKETLILNQKTNWISGLYVEPESRCKGAGDLLLKKAELSAAQLSIETIHTFSFNHHDFLQNRGWNSDEEEKFNDLDLIIWNKKLNQSHE